MHSPLTCPGLRRVRRAAGAEAGLTLIEVLVASLVLVIGLLGVAGSLVVATQTTKVDREQQAETSLAREVLEDSRSLAYTQLVPQTLASALQPSVTGSTVSGQGLLVARSPYNFTVSLNVCSLDDPTDGYGDHSVPPASGGVWCPDVAASGTTDTNPDDEKRLSVTVTPESGGQPAVQQTTLIQSHSGNGPAVSCLTTVQATCPGSNQVVTSSATTSLTFYVTTATRASSIQWLVNGGPPPAAQISSGSSDPYVPSSTSSQFTWQLPQADGTYTVAAYAQDGSGLTGARSAIQITLNRHQVIAPASITAGYDPLIAGVDIQWVPSVDQDVLYYNVYHQVGTGPVTLACGQVTGTSCTDMTAANPGTPPAQCTNPPTDYTSQPNVYWVVGVATDPSTGQPRESTQTSPQSDANLCDHPPSAPLLLTATPSNGAVVLNWSAPTGTGDPDAGDSIQGWRIYRWAAGGTPGFPQSRLVYIGATNGGHPVTSYTDSAPDPGGLPQSYCVTSVDTHLQESPCSNVAAG